MAGATNSHESVARSITWIAVIVGALTAITIPGIYLYTAISYEEARIQDLADQSVVDVSAVISHNPEHWLYMGHRIEGLLARFRSDRPRAYRLIDLEGRSIISQVAPISNLTLTGVAALRDGRRQVGVLEYTEDIEYVLMRSALAALLGIALGFAMFTALRILPLKALKDALENLKNANAKLNELNGNLEERIHERTAKVEAQARELRQSLDMQVEYNSLHREFISMASHEFRTPLCIIDGSAQLIMRKIDRITIEEVAKRMGNILSASARMIGLIESTLSAEQLEAGKIKMVLNTVDLPALLKAVQGRQEEITPSHQIKLNLQDIPDEIHGDAKLLEQVFANLLSNAVKYSPDNLRIDVTGRREGEKVLVTVRDYGLGVPADELPRLFQRYFRARTTIGIAGTGIGLHVVKKFVEMHGGSAQVESVEGKGSTFTVHLPITGPREQGMDSNDSHAPLTRPAVTAAA